MAKRTPKTLASQTLASQANPIASGLKTKIKAKPTTQAPHLVVVARAGTGKTTTLIEGLKDLKGMPTSITPSSQQLAIWEQMRLSKDARTICFVAFNKSIATELQARVPPGCEAMTMHSMGLKSITRAFDRCKVDGYRVQTIISEILERDIRDIRRDNPTLVSATEQLVGLCKANLVDPRSQFLHPGVPTLKDGLDQQLWWNEIVLELADYHDIDLNGAKAQILTLVPLILERCKDVARDKTIDFNDMIWLPCVLNLPVFRYDLLLCDEAQDLCRSQQQLALRAGERLILVGDPSQSIYGFAGADSGSIGRMQENLSQSARGCVSLPLSVTRRCGKAIVKEAQRLVPEFSAHDTNPEGLISRAFYPVQYTSGQLSNGIQETRPLREGETDYQTLAQDRDMVLCRYNAPLVSQCFQFLKKGRKANIQGRDIAAGLVATVRKQKAVTIPDLIARLEQWREYETKKELSKKNPSDARLDAVQDRVDCLLCFCDMVDDRDKATPEDVIRKIESVFTDDKTSPGIKLSSIHKAKGLEAHRVFLLQPKGYEIQKWRPNQQEWGIAENRNLLYVAITRAITELVYVS